MLGPNGAGKTTTLKAIVGWTPASRGRITFEGRNITRLKTEDIVRLGVTMVPQGRQVFSRLTVAENLMLGGLARAGRSSTGDMASDMLDMFTVLRERNRELAGNLSGGEQQQLVIARALMSNPAAGDLRRAFSRACTRSCRAHVRADCALALSRAHDHHRRAKRWVSARN